MANVTFKESTHGNESKNSTAMGPLDYFALVAVFVIAVLNDIVIQVERKEAEALYKQYKVDFDLFDYSPQTFLDMAGTSKSKKI